MNYANSPYIRMIIRQALEEDIGKRDITTELIIPKDKKSSTVLIAKENCVVCGIDIAKLVFKGQDKNIKFKPLCKDGQNIKKGKIIARIYGRASGILTAERVALNFLSLLSGIATTTRNYVDRIKPYKVKIMDTRKTIPGLRQLEKYAVMAGGGFNHRLRLDEMVMIKDNHIAASGFRLQASGVKKIIEAVKKKKTKDIKVEVEVKNLREFKEALMVKPDIIMLDNMKLIDTRKAVKIRGNMQYAIRNTLLEASGGITLKNVRRIASTGVDMISVGALTHSIKSIDISLEVL